MVLASVCACSKVPPGWSRTEARQISPSRSSLRELPSTTCRTTTASSFWPSMFSRSLLIRRSNMAPPREQDPGGKHGRANHLGGAVECLAHPHRCDGLRFRFIQVAGGSIEGIAQAGLELGRRQHQRLDRIGGLFRGSLAEPAPGTIRPLRILEPAKGGLADLRCPRDERADGVGGGIEGGTMPLVDPVVAVYTLVAQVLDDLLLDDMLAGERRHGLQDLEHMGIGRDRGIALEGEGEEEADPLEGAKRPG